MENKHTVTLKGGLNIVVIAEVIKTVKTSSTIIIADGTLIDFNRTIIEIKNNDTSVFRTSIPEEHWV